MENASKALIIAGAILISILLISVGIIVMNAINDPISQAGSSAESQAIEIFNSKFTAYMGSDLDYNAVKSLLTTMTSVNGSSDVKSGKVVSGKNVRTVEIDNQSTVKTVGDLKKDKTYKVVISDAKGSDGFYDNILITVNP